MLEGHRRSTWVIVPGNGKEVAGSGNFYIGAALKGKRHTPSREHGVTGAPKEQGLGLTGTEKDEGRVLRSQNRQAEQIQESSAVEEKKGAHPPDGARAGEWSRAAAADEKRPACQFWWVR